MKEPKYYLKKCHCCKEKKQCVYRRDPYLVEFREGAWQKKHWFCDDCIEQKEDDI